MTLKTRLAMRMLLPAALVALAVAAGCEPKRIEYPQEGFEKDRAGWGRVMRDWRKRYRNAFILQPARPWPKDYFSDRLLERTRWRVAVVGVIEGERSRPAGTAAEPGRGSGVVDHAAKLRWATRTYPAARGVDVEEAVLATLEQQLPDVAGFTVVNRRDLDRVFDERDLQRAFGDSSSMPPMDTLEGADAILVARAGELEYLVYSVDEVDGRKTISMQRARRGTIELRMIDVRDGKLLWSATTEYAPQHYLCAPLIVHPRAGDLPQALRGLPQTASAAADGAYMLVKRLAYRRSGFKNAGPITRRRRLGSHLRKEWQE